jgi:hypothetical protein
MGRSVDETKKTDRIQIRIKPEDRQAIESARLKYAPRLELQQFILEMFDLGLEVEILRSAQKKAYIDAVAAVDHLRKASNE